MKSLIHFVAGASIVLMMAAVSHAEIQIVVESNSNETTAPDFKFKTVPPPLKDDAAATAQFTIVDGRNDPNGGGVDTLRDGQVPTDEDHVLEGDLSRSAWNCAVH